MKKAAANYTIRLDQDVREALQALADADDRSLANYIERLLRQHVSDKRGRK